jgi:Domain of unknown function (DUF4124)
MGRFLLLSLVWMAAWFAPVAAAQTAFRCETNGTVAYSDKPCPPGNATKAVTATQDTAEQKASSKTANAQMRQDNADLNKRLTEREKLEAKERADARKATAKEKVAKPPKAGKGGKASKSKAPKQPAKKATGKAAKSTNGSAVTKP